MSAGEVDSGLVVASCGDSFVILLLFIKSGCLDGKNVILCMRLYIGLFYVYIQFL